jgi:hypothetical protein
MHLNKKRNQDERSENINTKNAKMNQTLSPPSPLHRPHKKQSIIKQPYKIEPLQAAVDFQPLSQPCSSSV